jgi:hypothetical protein
MGAVINITSVNDISHYFNQSVNQSVNQSNAAVKNTATRVGQSICNEDQKSDKNRTKQNHGITTCRQAITRCGGHRGQPHVY